ncbi:MAG: hypothetical protein WHS38_01320 [Thermodesulforhabdaceae bacterium]
MKEEIVSISVITKGEILRLEGRLAPGGASGVVICHPHPLYGGDMDNGVVMALQKAFSGEGFTTLRFNFRGAGDSEGNYDDGQGEVDDLIAACDFIKSRGVEHLYGAGYSFGSWILLRSLQKLLFKGLVLVAPPLNMLDFEGLNIPTSTPGLILVGSRDEFCHKNRLEAWLKENQSASVTIIEGENHFFWKSLPQVFERVKEEARKWLGKI